MNTTFEVTHLTVTAPRNHRQQIDLTLVNKSESGAEHVSVSVRIPGSDSTILELQRFAMVRAISLLQASIDSRLNPASEEIGHMLIE